MTTAVPLIFSFPEFSGVAEAVADHIITAQNKALYPSNSTSTDDSINLNSNSTDISNQNTNISQDINNNINNNSNININNTNSNNISSQALNHAPSSSTNSQIRKKKKDLNRRFKIGLSGGSLINVLHEGLLKRDDVEWSKWDIYFADERLVLFSSPESNYGKAKSQLFDLIPKHKGSPRVFPIDESLIDDPQECADNYEKTLIKGFASKDSVKLPMFDLILLGCAPDGHVASLFPNQDTLRENYAWCVPVENSPVGPSKRITLTVPVICHSQMVSFVVEGSTKAPVLSTIMERPDKGLPASIINEQAAGRIAWFVDDDAISDVAGITKKRYKFTAEK